MGLGGYCSEGQPVNVVTHPQSISGASCFFVAIIVAFEKFFIGNEISFASFLFNTLLKRGSISFRAIDSKK